ncbi:MAG: hypothetical protein KC646_17655 [Candidatus Cloacimonetes bacterium]|nr:hypothetical protein [Candidatus Cloacimonadota bacterium]
MAGRFNHALGLRLLWGTILLMVVTGYVKSYSLKQSAPETTPKYARAWIKSAYGMNQLSIQRDKIPILPKDGWSNPFYNFEEEKLLISAGKDERFNTKDDLIFPIFVSSCTDKMQDLILAKVSKAHNNFTDLPKSITLINSKNTLIEGSQFCPIPDFSGPDKVYGTNDDLVNNLIVLKR